MPHLRQAVVALTISLSLGLHGVANAADTGKQYENAVSRGVSYLVSSQAEDGSWSSHTGPAVTALAATALMRHGRTPSDPIVAHALEYVTAHAHDDGGIYGDGSNHRNYETCLAAMCLTEANSGGKYDKLLKGCDKFLKQLQWNDDEGHDIGSMSYGGAGYGSHKRPDLSNTSFFIDALKELGNGPDDQAMQQALVFVCRCQNLETEHNTSKYAAKVNDGGFYYTVAAGASSQAGETPQGGLRSYGSMTYAGLKSMLFAGVDKDDQRVKAAFDWVSKHYTLDENPGMGSQGLYYYYHTFAKALDAMGVEEVGKGHAWRGDLIAKLASAQREDGAWVNKSDRWMESDPNLVTSYSLMALAYAQPK